LLQEHYDSGSYPTIKKDAATLEQSYLLPLAI
jgi:hypothetical protein